MIRQILKPLVFAASLSPVAFLLWDGFTHHLNVNPFNAIVRSTGFWSLRFLCLTLAITPLRWLTGWHSVVKFRRMLGLFGFFYGTLHTVAYVLFDRLAGLDAFSLKHPAELRIGRTPRQGLEHGGRRGGPTLDEQTSVCVASSANRVGRSQDF